MCIALGSFYFASFGDWGRERKGWLGKEGGLGGGEGRLCGKNFFFFRCLMGGSLGEGRGGKGIDTVLILSFYGRGGGNRRGSWEVGGGGGKWKVRAWNGMGWR